MAEWGEMRVRSGPDTSPKCAAWGSSASGSENCPSFDASPLCRSPLYLLKVQAPATSRRGDAGIAPRPEARRAVPPFSVRSGCAVPFLSRSSTKRGRAEGRDPEAHRK